MSRDTISRERLEAPPGQVYAETVLEPGYRFMLEHYFHPLVETNRAWVAMLRERGIVPEASAATLLEAVDELGRLGPSALGDFDPRYEYFYSHMERWLIERVGEEVAGEINIGRTRPEPLTRMVLRERLLALAEEVVALAELLLDRAEREVETVMPQWTHFQHAQLSTLGHYLVAIANALERDGQRLLAAYATTNASTLGCGALAGTSYPVDRDLVARLLGFDRVRENTIDAVSGGDHVLEATAAVAGLMVTLSRLCQDLYIWHTEEFGFVTVADAFAGSSSMMPQKKNAYPFEYVRARAAHAIGDATAAFGTLHNTNYQDIKDVEEEMVPPAFRTLEEASRSVRLLAGTIGSLEVHRERMLAQAGAGFAAATELAATIHRRTGLSARTAHRVVGNLVLRASKAGRGGRDVDLALVNEAARAIVGHELDGVDEEAVRRALDPRGFVEAHDVPGGPAPARVREAIAAARERLDGHLRGRVRDARERLAAAHRELDDLVKQRRQAVV
jgi:argininosuccinate lyase